MKRIYFVLLSLFFVVATSINAQVTIGSQDEPHPAAVLDLKSSTQGLLLPNVALDMGDLTKFVLDGGVTKEAAEGMIVYNTEDKKVYVWNGERWNNLSVEEITTTPCGTNGIPGTLVVGNNIYQTYMYGDNCWMVSNSKEGESFATMYDNDPSKVNGYYYTSLLQAHRACPDGWHLPRESEWEALKSFVNDDPSGIGKWWTSTEGNAFAGTYDYRYLNWFWWESDGRWWSANEDYQYYYSDGYGLGGPAVDSRFTPSVRCVQDQQTISVTDVSITPETETLTSVGAMLQLEATVSPSNATNKNVTWSSSDEGVAKVDATGLVTAVANGEAIIKVKTVDGGIEATANVSVNVPVEPVEFDITGYSPEGELINNSHYISVPYGGIITLMVHVQGEGTITYQWYNATGFYETNNGYDSGEIVPGATDNFITISAGNNHDGRLHTECCMDYRYPYCIVKQDIGGKTEVFRTVIFAINSPEICPPF